MNNVYQRPLFMQQGGSTRPMLPSPPQGMMGQAAPPMPRQAMAQAAPRPQVPPMAAPGPRPAGPMAPPGGGAPDMAGIASMISQKAKADISQAQGPEEIINAFRGNQRPLQARYQELAQYVGPQDATATPVSVLTMIQPSLMMTADGAAQSGIGELMAGITSDVAMEEAPGVPSRMGQGVGQLMMAGQPPQPAGMAHGGIVKKFREGGSSLRDYYNEDLATYQDIMAPTDADRRTAKQSMLMDISSRALANASGAGGDRNIASQVAGIFETLPSNYAAYQNQLRQGEGATRQAALQSASGRVNADRASALKKAESDYEQGLMTTREYQKFIYDMTLENAKAGNKVTAPEIVTLKDAADNVVTYNLTVPAELAAYRRAFSSGDTPVNMEPPSPGTASDDLMTPARITTIFGDADLIEALKTDKITPAELTRLNTAIAAKTRPREQASGNFGPDGMEIIQTIAGEQLSQQWNRAIQEAQARGVEVESPSYFSGETDQPSSPNLEQEAVVENIPDLLDPTFIEWNPADSFGTQAQADAFINSVIPKVVNLITGSEAGAGSGAEIRAESSIKALNAFILQTLYSAASGNSGDKLGVDERKTFSDLIPGPGTPAEVAANQYERINDEFSNLIAQKRIELNQPQSQISKQRIRQQIVNLESRSAQVLELTSAIRSGISGAPPIVDTDLNSLQQQYIRGPARVQ